MKKKFSLPVLLVFLSACDSSDSEINDAVVNSYATQDAPHVQSISYGEADGLNYACATMTARTPFGETTGPYQVPVIKNREGEWVTFPLIENVSAEQCIKVLADDLIGLNDSVAPADFQEELPQDQRKEVNVAFDREEVRWSEEYGDNVIQGSAALKSRSGKSYFCSPDPDSVKLIPVSGYARERMRLLYGNDNSGFRGTTSDLADGDPLYLNMMRSTNCDESGRFIFQNVPDGEYFIVTSVMWTAHKLFPETLIQGGMLMKRVSVSGDTVEKVNLSYQ